MIPSIWRNVKRYREAMFEDSLAEDRLKNTLYRVLSLPRSKSCLKARFVLRT